MSRFPADYAKAIAYSPYISELNGDNRERSHRETLVTALPRDRTDLLIPKKQQLI